MFEKLSAIFSDCLFKEAELIDNKTPPEGAVLVEGLTQNFGFHPQRLDSHKAEVARMLLELPDEFMASKGGGWSFLNACNDKHGNQWTSFHQVMQELFVLGIGLGLCQYLLPRETWKILPGGVPYIAINDTAAKEILAAHEPDESPAPSV